MNLSLSKFNRHWQKFRITRYARIDHFNIRCQLREIVYREISNDPIEVSKKVQTLLADPFVKNKKGIFEYILDGEQDTRLLDIRIFEENTKRSVYAMQTKTATDLGVSNCPLCAMGHEANRTRIWKLTEMDADHVSAWSKGGATDIENCQMLCKTHNRAKGNR